MHRAKHWVLVLSLIGPLAHAQPSPKTTLTDPGDVLIGETFSLEVTLDNEGPDPGFAPRSTLTLPDGVSYVASDPPARQVTTDPATGVTTVRIDHPVGSMTVTQPALSAALTLRMESSTRQPVAAISPGTPFTIQASGSLFTSPDLSAQVNDGPVSATARAGAYVLSAAWLTPAGEGEVPYGPSFPVQVQLRLEVAPGADLSDVRLSEALPPTFFYQGFSSSYTTGMVQTQAPAAPGVNAGSLQLDWPTVPRDTEIEVTIDGYFPHKSQGGPALTPPGSVQVTHSASSSATFDDAGTPLALAQTAEAVIAVRALTIAKSRVASAAPLVPGQTPPHSLTYTLTIRVADEHDFSVTGAPVTLTDVFSDGQDFDGSFNGGAGASLDGGAAPTNFTFAVDTAGDYATTLRVTLDQSVPAEQLTPGRTLRLRYRTTLPERFKDPALGPVRASDSLSNRVSVAGTGRDRVTSQDETFTPETSQTSVQTVGAQLEKTVAAIYRPGTGLLTLPANVQAGDYVLFRLNMTFPNGDAREVALYDYLPIPLFKNTRALARGATPPGSSGLQGSFTPNAGNTADPPGTTGLAPADFFDLARIAVGQNELGIPLGTIASGADPYVIDYSFWIPVEGVAYADDLLQVNQLVGNYEGTLSGQLRAAVRSVSLRADAPQLEVVKSAGLSATLAEGQTLSGFDAGDLVFFRFDVKNVGAAPARNVRIVDTMPANVSFVSGSLSGDAPDSITPDADGANPVTFVFDAVPAGTTRTFVFQGLVSAGSVVGTSGDALSENRGDAFFSAGVGGEDYDTITAITTLRSAQPQVTLALVDHDLADTPLGQGTVGEVFTYEALVTLPEGVTEGLQVRLLVPSHLAYMGDFTPASDVLPGAGGAAFQGSDPVSLARVDSPSGPGTSGQDLIVRFDQGNPGGNLSVAVNNDGDNGNNQFALRLRLFALDTLPSAPSVRETRARISHDNGGDVTSAAASLTLQRPDVQVTSFALDPTTGDAGDTPSLRLSLRNAGGAKAYDGRIELNLGDQVTLPATPSVPGYRVTTASLGGDTILILDDDGAANPAVLDAGATLDLSIPVRVADTASVGSSLSFGLRARYESYEGDDNAAGGTSPAQGFEEAIDEDSASASLAPKLPSVSASFVAGSSSLPDSDTSGSHLTVGETAGLRFEFGLPEGTIDEGRITIPLPAGLELHDADGDGGPDLGDLSISGPFSASDFTFARAGADLILSFVDPAAVLSGDNTPDTLRVDVPVLALDSPALSAGSDLSQSGASLRIEPPSGALTRTQPAPITITGALPQLDPAKAFSPDQAAGGETVTVTLTLTPAAGDTRSSAFGVLVLEDDLADPDLSYVDGSATPPNGDWTFSQPTPHTVRFTSSAGTKLTKGSAPLTFTFQARVRDAIEVGKKVPNTAGLSYFSAPVGAPVRRALSETSPQVELQIQAPQVRQILSATSDAATPQTLGSFSPAFAGGGAQVAPGEVLSFTSEVLLPVGTSRALRVNGLLSDATSFPGFGVAQLVPGSVTIDASGFGGSAGSSERATLEAVVPSGGGAPGADFQLDFGDVVLAPADQAANRVLISYQARVLSTASANALPHAPANERGDALRQQTSAVVDVPLSGDVTIRSNAVDAAIVKPVLALSKAISSANGDAGDLLTVTLTLSNSGDASAHQVALVDVLDARFEAPTLIGAPPAGFSDASSGQTLRLQGGTLAPLTTRVVQFTTRPRVSAVAGTSIDNQATGQATTLGEEALQPEEESPAQASNTVSFAVDLPGAPSQTVLSTSEPLTPDAPGGDAARPQLTPGEELSLRVRLPFPEGTSEDVRYDVSVPEGLSLIGASAPAAAGVTFSDPGAGSAITGGRRFDLGDVVRSVGGQAYLDLNLTFRVEPTTPVGSEVIAGALDFAHGGPLAAAPAITAAIVRPDLSLTKVLVGGASGDAGDARRFDLTLSNNGSGPARLVEVRDTVAPETYLVTALADPDDAFASETFSAASGEVAFTQGALLPGASTTLRIEVVVRDSVGAGSTTSNTAQGQFSTAQSGGQTLAIPATPAAGADFSVAKVTLAQVEPSSDPDTPGQSAAIGEVVSHTFTFTLPEGTTRDLVSVIEVPPGFRYLPGSARVVPGSFAGTLPAPTLSGGASAGEDLSLDWSAAAITNPGDGVGGNDAFQVEVGLVVDPSAAGLPPGQDSLVVDARLTHRDSGGVIEASPGAGEATAVVEPRLEILSSTWSVNSADAGDALRLSVQIRNSGTGPAHDVSLDDLLGASFVRQAQSLSGAGAESFSDLSAGNAVSFRGGTIPAGGALTLDVDVTLAESVESGASLSTTTALSGSSRPGVPPAGFAERSTSASRTSEAIQVGAPSLSALGLSSSDNPDTPGASLTLGERATWAFTVELAEGRTSGLVLRDLLPAELQYSGDPVTLLDADGDLSFVDGVSPSVDPAGGGPGDPIEITIGRVDNPAAGGGDQRFVVLVPTRVVAGGGLPPVQTTLTQRGELRYSNDGGAALSGPSVDAQVVEPRLTIAKSFSPATGDASTTTTITIRLTNAGTSPAYDLSVRDPLAAVFRDEATPIVVAPTGWSVGALSPTVIVASGDASLAPGASVDVTITCEIDASVGAPSVNSNVAQVSYSSSPGAPTGERSTGPVDSPTATFSVGVPGGPMQRVAATSLAETPTTPLRLNEGETITVAVDVPFPAGTTSDVVYEVAVPPGLAYVAGSAEVLVPATFSAGGGSVGNSPPSVGPAGPYGSGDDVSLTLGRVVRTGSSDTLTLRYQLRLLPGELATGSAAAIGGELRFAGGSAATTPTLSPVVSEPSLELTKRLSPDAGNGGDLTTIQLEVRNTGTGPAYGITLSDALDPRYTVVQVVDNPRFSESAPPAGAGGTVTFSEGTLGAGESTTCEIQVRVEAGILAGTTIPNTAEVAGLSAPSGGEASPLVGGGRSSASYTVQSPETRKTLDAAPDPTSDPSTAAGTATIGEQVTFRLQVAIPEGVTQDLEVRDSLPPGLDYVRYELDRRAFLGELPEPAVLDDQAPSGRDVVFRWATLSNPADGVESNDRFDLLVTCVVLDVPDNVGTQPPGQSTIANTGSFSFSGNPASAIGAVELQVVEPRLELTQSVTVPGGGGAIAGDTLTFTTNVRNTGTSPSHDVVSEVVLDARRYVVPSIAAGDLPPGWSLTTLSGPGPDQVRVRFALEAGRSLAPLRDAELSFTARLKQVSAEADVVSAASARGTSSPGEVSGERSQSAQAEARYDLLDLPPNLDRDGDGVYDRDEGAAAGLDTDGDGIPDFLDLDSDGDGLSDSSEAGVGLGATLPDTDGDGTPDLRDLDSDGDGIPDAVEGARDSDGDGAPDYRDPDSDGDGIPDALEAGASGERPRDSDGDGTPDYRDPDSDGDGISDALEAGLAGQRLAANAQELRDSDADGVPDYLDQDSDGDGIADAIEVGLSGGSPLDTDGDGTPDYLDLDSDGDGAPDSFEAGPTPESPQDSDGDGVPDYLDQDSDGDGIADAIEVGSPGQSPLDTDGDGVPDYLDQDSDGDGVPDSQEQGDADGDGVPDFRQRGGDLQIEGTLRVQGSGSSGCSLSAPLDSGRGGGASAVLLALLSLLVRWRRGL